MGRAGFGWFWVVSGGFGWFQVIPFLVITSAICGYHSDQLRRDTIWVYPEYGASSCVQHIVSQGLDGLRNLISKKSHLVFKKYPMLLETQQAVFCKVSCVI